jgi:glucose-6-phosphate-specific signal transduction histidine kinase
MIKTDLKTLLENSDFVTCHVPLTEKTKHLINSETLSYMKPTSFLINTGRGVTGMQERATAVGGTLTASPVPRGGFRVSAVLPLTTAGTPS